MNYVQIGGVVYWYVSQIIYIYTAHRRGILVLKLGFGIPVRMSTTEWGPHHGHYKAGLDIERMSQGDVGAINILARCQERLSDPIGPYWGT